MLISNYKTLRYPKQITEHFLFGNANYIANTYTSLLSRMRSLSS